MAEAESLRTPDLIALIERDFHAVHRAEIPPLVELARKVERVHADVAVAPKGLAVALEEAQRDLDLHMKKEEMILFPAMRRGGAEGLVNPITVMRSDHKDHLETISRLEDLCHGFALPDGACGSWRALYAGVSKFCADLREHMHLENDILFPRFELSAPHRCICAHG